MMGYVSKDIAVITEPSKLTSSSAPNFITFKSKPATKTFLQVRIEVVATPALPDLETATEIIVTAVDGTIHTFHGTADPEEVGGNVFFVAADTADTAENLKTALMLDPWIKANFEIIIPFDLSGTTPANGKTLILKGREAGDDYEFTLSAPGNTGNAAFIINWVQSTSTRNDSISGEASTAEIHLDVFLNPNVFLGGDDLPETPDKIGTYQTTLSKTYAGGLVWFDLNSLFNQYQKYNLPPDAFGWFDPGTLNVFRVAAKVKGINSFSFYQSNALYVLNGFGRVSKSLDLEDRIYDTSENVVLLSDKPTTPYVRGQKEFLNFILKDNQRDLSNPIEFTLRVAYRVYSTGGTYLGTVYNHARNRPQFNILNTCALNIDTVLDTYPKAGKIKVSLARGTAIVSNELEYEILPDCRHTLNAFTFLNRFGGWDTFNWDAEEKDEVKPEIETFNRAATPTDFKNGQTHVYSVSLANSRTIEGATVSDEVAEWLKELAASRVILNNKKERIVIEDFTLKKDSVNSDQHSPIIKYKLSEAYVNG